MIFECPFVLSNEDVSAGCFAEGRFNGSLPPTYRETDGKKGRGREGKESQVWKDVSRRTGKQNEACEEKSFYMCIKGT